MAKGMKKEEIKEKKKNDSNVDEEGKVRLKKEKKKVNEKILESKKIIKEEKEKIRIEKRNIRNKKYEKLKKKRFFRFLNKIFKSDREAYSFSELFVVTLVSLAIGAFACFSVLTIFTGGRNYFKLSKDLGKLFDVYETLTDNYYDTIDKEKIVEDAISGMVSSVGDVYTSYNDTESTKKFNELVSGVYEGIGCTIQLQEDGLKIIDIFDDSPSEKAGLKVNDIILKVDDKEVTQDINVSSLSEYIKTEADENITMIISRDGKELTVHLKRDKVETPVVTSAIYEKNDKKIGYLSISIFSSVAAKQFKKELVALENEGISGLVIDVRGNNGGYLSTVTEIVSQLLPKGKVIYQIEKDGDREVTKDKTSTSRDYPIAVLINGNSASASEILAGAIKESYKDGYVVGTTSYGKGTVQQVKQLEDGSMIKYTVENWLTPLGNWINGVGIEPTDVVEFDASYYDNPVATNDNQLQRALDLVS